LWSATAATHDALLHVSLEHAESLFVSLDRHVQGLQHSFGGEVVDDDPLLNVDWLSWDAKGLRIQAEVEDQLFRRARDAAEICIERNRVLVRDFNTLLLLLRLLRSSLRLIAIFRACSILIGHDISP
jgi:hypothetical protein